MLFNKGKGIGHKPYSRRLAHVSRTIAKDFFKIGWFIISEKLRLDGTKKSQPFSQTTLRKKKIRSLNLTKQNRSVKSINNLLLPNFHPMLMPDKANVIFFRVFCPNKVATVTQFNWFPSATRKHFRLGFGLSIDRFYLTG